jgi:hypothetical protein
MNSAQEALNWEVLYQHYYEGIFPKADALGREIMKVEISQSKSTWFGESEKLIKKIFKDYQELAAHTVKAPILLFNEADAMLSSRKSRSNGAVSQTENAMQNILLKNWKVSKAFSLQRPTWLKTWTKPLTVDSCTRLSFTVRDWPHERVSGNPN